jgi:hypothetical protein
MRWARLIALLAVPVAGCVSAGPYTYGPSGPLPCEIAPCGVDLRAYRSVQERAGQDSDLVIAVAISGGGHRAGNFATGALIGLEELPWADRDLLDEVDYFSTVSGGGFAAASYLASRLEHEQTMPDERYRFAAAVDAHCDPHGPRDRCRRFALIRGYEGVFAWLRHPRIIFGPVNAGDLLERDLDTRVLSLWTTDTGTSRRRSLTLRDVFVPRDSARRPTLPYWVANAAVYRNGAIFPFTPDVLERYRVSRYRHRLERDTLRDPFDMPLAVGVKASVSVPGLIPLTTLESDSGRRFRYLRLLDGGVADNLGVLTAADLLCQDSVRAPQDARRRLMLIVDAYPEDGMPYDARGGGSAVGNALRAALIGLDSWHGRYQSVLGVIGRQCGFTFVSIDFDGLDGTRQAAASGTPEDRDTCLRRIAPALHASGETTEEALARLHRAVLAVGTRLRSSPAEQARLMTAGRLAVCFARPAILAALR